MAAEGEQDLQNDILAESQNVMDTVEPKEATGGITIEVCNPKVKDDTFNKYVCYTIKGVDKNGAFEVVRRYSDFDKVRSVLVAKWPGCYIPPLPPKALNSLDAKFVKERRRYLHVFCQKIAAIPMLHYFPAYQEFLRSKHSNLEKVFQPMLQTDYEDIITRYNTHFPQLKEKEFSITLIKKISEFKDFLKKVKTHNEKVKKFAKTMVKAKNTFYQEFAFLNGLVSMEYEKSVFTQYHGTGDAGNVFYGEKSADLLGHSEKIETASKQASFEYLTEWYRAESREFEALIDAITQQETYVNLKAKALEKQKSDTDGLNKVLSGKSTVKGVLFRKSKDDEAKDLEKKVEKRTKEVEQLTTLNELITLIVGHEEIDKFKNGKMKPYYNCIRATAKKELDTLTNMESYWKTILENKNIEKLSTEA